MKQARTEIVWESGFLTHHPAFAPFQWAQPWCDGFARGWPAVADYASLAKLRGVEFTNVHGQAITFRSAAQHLPHYDYERSIEQDAIVPTRERDRHDLFNTLAWFSFPRSKACLHHTQWRELQRTNRSTRSDALRLFDENGVIVLCADDGLSALLTQMRWKELFWHERQPTQSRLRFLPFGHGLCHKLLQPFVGITGKAIVIAVPARTLDQPIENLSALADVSLSSRLEELRSPQALHPLPVLGIPGWWPQDEAFYEDQTYFRSRRELQSTHPQLTSL